MNYLLIKIKGINESIDIWTGRQFNWNYRSDRTTDFIKEKNQKNYV